MVIQGGYISTVGVSSEENYTAHSGVRESHEVPAVVLLDYRLAPHTLSAARDPSPGTSGIGGGGLQQLREV